MSEGSPEPQGFRAVAYTKQTLTSSQVHTLVMIISNMHMTLRSLSGLDDVSEDQPDHSGTRLCGGVKASLETTIIEASDRLSEILSDKSRWNTEGTDSISESIKSVHRQQVSVLKAQQEQIEAEIRPAIIFKPQIFALGGKWWCVHGEDVNNRLVGTGSTPYEAVKDFEQRYYNQKATEGQ